MADIFQEIDEELRQEKFGKLWKRYGTYVIGVVTLIVVLVAAGFGWREYQRSAQEADGAAFAAAQAKLQSGDAASAAGDFASLAGSAGGGYEVLARLQQAQALSRSGDPESAAAAYEQIIADRGLDPILRDLALVLLALTTIDTADPAALRERMRPLLSESNPWRYSAREIEALLALRTGDTEGARALLTALSDDVDAPTGLRGRAAELLATLGG